MNNTFFYLNNSEISPDLSETARYLGYKKSNPPEKDISLLIEKAASEIKKLLKPQGIYEIFPLKIEIISENCQILPNSLQKNDEISSNSDKNTLNLLKNTKFEQKTSAKFTFADTSIISHDLLNNLKDSKEIALIAATIGPQVDSYIRRAQLTDPVYASICQATGAMYIEKIVDGLNKEIKNIAHSKGKSTYPRYSPGYGDVPLTVQKDFFRLLNCERIGLTLMDTLIMAPEKSVTAFIGIK